MLMESRLLDRKSDKAQKKVTVCSVLDEEVVSKTSSIRD